MLRRFVSGFRAVSVVSGAYGLSCRMTPELPDEHLFKPLMLDSPGVVVGKRAGKASS